MTTDLKIASALKEGDHDKGRKHIDKSLDLSHFFHNVAFKVTLYSSDLSDENRVLLKKKLSGLVLNKQYELLSVASDVDSMIDSYVKELILGSYMTSINWCSIAKKVSDIVWQTCNRTT